MRGILNTPSLPHPLYHCEDLGSSSALFPCTEQRTLQSSAERKDPSLFLAATFSRHISTQTHANTQLVGSSSSFLFCRLSSEVSQGFFSPPPPPSLSAKQTNRQDPQSPCAFYRNSWQIKEKSPQLLSLRSELCLSTHTELTAGEPPASDGSTEAADRREVGGGAHLDKIDKETCQQISARIVITVFFFLM